jgi:hypothetical protein
MSIDFRQVQQTVIELSERAPLRFHQRRELLSRARGLLHEWAERGSELRAKADQARHYERNLRCALPTVERLDKRGPLPPAVPAAVLLAADGSQIPTEHGLPVEYCLINVGAVRMQPGSGEVPRIHIQSELLYDEQLYTPTGEITDATLALLRDTKERSVLAGLAEAESGPVIALTDGPVELAAGYGGERPDSTEFQRQLEDYRAALHRLERRGAAVAGYVDKPRSGLLARLLEIALASPSDLQALHTYHPLRGVTDDLLLRDLLAPGQRSAVYGLSSGFSAAYSDGLALHFFYLNVGAPGAAHIARVDVPAWVVEEPDLLNGLHAALVEQCRASGGRPYPYILHRAHESATVTFDERREVTDMIVQALLDHGIPLDDISAKQFYKDLQGRTRYRS